MRRLTTYKILTVFLVCATSIVTAQRNNFITTATEKQSQDYYELLKLGYSNQEIFEDLGNVNFLTQNYKSAVFWYEKLTPELRGKEIQKRYDASIAHLKNNKTNQKTKKNAWFAAVKKDYLRDNQKGIVNAEAMTSLKKTIHKIHVANQSFSDAYEPKITITKDGGTAYFSKAVYKKPLYGLFSKKELIHEIYRAENINGNWQNIEKVIVCPEHFSAKHPTVSNDGRKLYFASNMPGTFGSYDIFVAEIKADGKFGVAKNLGTKVNTNKDDLYPNLHNDTLLFFASEGHEGYGGLDLYASQIDRNSLTKSFNLGQKINSRFDEYSIQLAPTDKMGYVATNRGMNGNTQEFAVSYAKQYDNTRVAKNEERLLKMLRDKSQIEYSNTTFEDEK